MDVFCFSCVAAGVMSVSNGVVVRANHAVEPTTQSVLATLALIWVPSLRSAAAQRERYR